MASYSPSGGAPVDSGGGGALLAGEQWVNRRRALLGEVPLQDDQGIRCLTSEEGAATAGIDPAHHQKDLYDAIERGEFPSWTLESAGDAGEGRRHLPLRSFDLTKVWPYRDHPLLPMGKLVLDRVPDNFFAEWSRRRSNPANFVPGSVPLRTACCRRGSSPTATRHATGWDQPHPVAGERGEGRVGRPAELRP